MENNVLKHYGVPGMKWGVRHDRRGKSMRGKSIDPDIENGSPKSFSKRASGDSNTGSRRIAKGSKKANNKNTPEDVSRKDPNYVVIGKSASNAAKDASRIADIIGKSAGRSKDVQRELETMSDEELRRRINRINMEQQYSDLNPSRVAKGANVAKSVLETVGAVAGIAASVAAIIGAFKK